MVTEVDNYRQRVFRYSLVDGTTELGLGLFLLLWAGLVAGPLNRNIDATWFAVVFGAVATYSLVVHCGTRLVRSRITYPRTGFVRPRVSRAMVVVPIVAALVIAGAMVVIFTRNPTDPRLLSGVAGFVIGAGFCYKGWRMATGRLLIIGMVAMAAGLAVPLVAQSLMTAQALLFTTVGLALLISGGSTLWSYLRTTSPPADAAE
jgi:hypothetical protein